MTDQKLLEKLLEVMAVYGAVFMHFMLHKKGEKRHFLSIFRLMNVHTSSYRESNHSNHQKSVHQSHC